MSDSKSHAGAGGGLGSSLGGRSYGLLTMFTDPLPMDRGDLLGFLNGLLAFDQHTASMHIFATSNKRNVILLLLKNNLF